MVTGELKSKIAEMERFSRLSGSKNVQCCSGTGISFY